MNNDHKLLGTDLDKIAHSPIPFDDAPPEDAISAHENKYRMAARAACEINDAITGARTEVPLGADVETDDGGAWVECRIFITTAQAQGEN